MLPEILPPNSNRIPDGTSCTISGLKACSSWLGEIGLFVPFETHEFATSPCQG
jgi:hypothetical protein